MLAAVFSLEGTALTEREDTLFRKADPCGFILFGRNIETPQQLKDLISSLKKCVGWDCPILIDQEGGRVQRLKPPHWTDFPAAATYNGNQNVLKQDMGVLTQELTEVGINVNCAPVLDMSREDTHDSIGNRAYASDYEVIVQSASTVIETFLAQGLTPVIKHLPGQGRATCDSHEKLPRVSETLECLSESDFVPCQKIAQKYRTKIWGMVAHVLYEKLDPDLPSTLSHKVLKDIIRDKIGFSGFLVSDDISMGALKPYGTVVDRSKLALDAGCDCVLYCAGLYTEMEQLAKSLPPLSDEALLRLEQSKRWKHQTQKNRHYL